MGVRGVAKVGQARPVKAAAAVPAELSPPPAAAAAPSRSTSSPASAPAPKSARSSSSPAPRPGRSTSSSVVEGGAGVVLGILFWSWVALPFFKGGPTAVRDLMRAKFFNKAADGSWLP